MAVLLMRQWQLVVLKVRLDLSRRAPAIVSDLLAHPDGQETVLWSRVDPLQAFGLQAGTSPPTRLRLPPGFDVAVTEALTTPDGSGTAPAALWLRLVPPYGYLGAVPWEDLVARVGIPVLRVPDRLPVPVEFGPEWSAAIVVSAPRGATWGADHVRHRVDALRRHLTTTMTLDVFADTHTHDLLADDLELLGDGRVRLHDPSAAMPAHRARSERRARQSRGVRAARPPLHEANLVWTDWIIAGLAGRAVRALHIAGPGSFERDRPTVRFSPDPAGWSRGPWASATDDELCLLADVLGAPLVTFASPPSHHSDVAIRMLADGIGQSRPGPTVYSSMRQDPGCEAIASVEAFFADRRRPMPIPRHRSLFGYVQPESVQGELTQGWSPAAAATVYGRPDGPDWIFGDHGGRDWDGGVGQTQAALQLATTAGTHGPGGPVPSWVASSARFIDRQRAALLSTVAVPGEPIATKRAYDEGVASALEEIQDLIVGRAGEQP